MSYINALSALSDNWLRMRIIKKPSLGSVAVKQQPILADISDAIPLLRKSEIKVAEFVLKHAQQVIHMRIVDLAQEAQVSEPTIVRFCRAIGCNSFQEFKVRIAQEMAISNNIGHFAIEEDDSAEDICNKIADTTIERLKQTREHLSSPQIAQAALAISQANRVELYGFGASSAVATDAQHKFFRLQVSTIAYSDPHMQAMAAVGLSREDVVIAISQSGRTKDLLHSVQLAQQAGAQVISLAPARTALSDMADLPIDINIEEDTERFTPMTSRLAHLMVIDMLTVIVARQSGPKLIAHLNSIKQSIRSLYLKPDA